MRVAEGGLADKAGVKLSWVLVAINGTSIQGLPQPQVCVGVLCVCMRAYVHFLVPSYFD